MQMADLWSECVLTEKMSAGGVFGPRDGLWKKTTLHTSPQRLALTYCHPTFAPQVRHVRRVDKQRRRRRCSTKPSFRHLFARRLMVGREEKTSAQGWA